LLDAAKNDKTKKGTLFMERKPVKTLLIMRVSGGSKPFTMKAKSELQIKRRLGHKSLDYLIQEDLRKTQQR